jgi:hypothetical protein
MNPTQSGVGPPSLSYPGIAASFRPSVERTSAEVLVAAPRLAITWHAEDRWRGRVGRGSLRDFLATAKQSKRPPRWSTFVDHDEIGGWSFATNADWPGVCALIRNAAVLSIHTRSMAKHSRSFVDEARHVARRKVMSAP